MVRNPQVPGHREHTEIIIMIRISKGPALTEVCYGTPVVMYIPSEWTMSGEECCVVGGEEVKKSRETFLGKKMVEVFR